MSQSACEALSTELVAYVDGEQPEAERARIAAHVGRCLTCRREIDRITKLRALLVSLPSVEPSADFDARMWERLSDGAPVRRRSGRLWAAYWALPLAAAAGMAIAWYSLVASRPAGGPTGLPRPGSQVAEVASPKSDGPGVVARQKAAPNTESQIAAAAKGAPAELTPEDLPPELLAQPELFLRLPVVEQLDRLEHFEEVRLREEHEPLGELPIGTRGARTVGRG
jgi:anti-sigma factor RsiW